MNRKLRILSAALLVALAPVAEAQTTGDVDAQVKTLDSAAANRGQTLVAARIAATFGTLAGSTDNTLALVNALRTGSAVTLTSTPTGTGTTTGTGTSTGTGATPTTTSTTITPPTGKMGWGNVFISLALAKTELANLGITNPTQAQLQAALTGGTVTGADGTTTTLKGVLAMRASGMGWGQIAQAEGTKLGPVVSSLRHEHVRVASLPSGSSTTTTTTASKPTLASGDRDDSTGGHGKSSKGLTTASGSASSTLSGSQHGSKGLTTATGVASPSSSRGIVTAGGVTSTTTHGRTSAPGQGIVTASGGMAGSTVTAKPVHGGGAGVTTASGAGATAVTTAQGGAGETHGHGGKGKGGG